MISERLQETLLMLVSANDTPRFYNVAESFLVLALLLFLVLELASLCFILCSG